MIPASDLWMLGLRPLRGVSAAVPTSGASQPLRDLGELFPDWAPHPSPDSELAAPESEPVEAPIAPVQAAHAGWRALVHRLIALAERLAGKEATHGKS